MIRQAKPKFNKKKTEEVIKYLLNRCGQLEEKKLTALLYFISFDYYEIFEEHLTGMTFLKIK